MGPGDEAGLRRMSLRNRAFVVAALAAVLAAGPARASVQKCDVFPEGRERAQCACALQVGGWVTKVHDRWRVVYVRRHQERYCHDKVEAEQTPR